MASTEIRDVREPASTAVDTLSPRCNTVYLNSKESGEMAEGILDGADESPEPEDASDSLIAADGFAGATQGDRVLGFLRVSLRTRK
jgi:hypothetical protein